MAERLAGCREEIADGPNPDVRDSQRTEGDNTTRESRPEENHGNHSTMTQLCRTTSAKGGNGSGPRGSSRVQFLFLFLFLLVANSCGDAAGTHLQGIVERGELVVVTRNGFTTYYEGPDGPQGLEYELASRFADYLGVHLKMVVAADRHELLEMLRRGEADLAAAGLRAAAGDGGNDISWGPTYNRVTSQLVYRAGTRRPRKPEALAGALVEVVAGTPQEHEVARLAEQVPDLKWEASRDLESEELLYLVWQQLIDHAVVDSSEFSLARLLYPELRVAFELSGPHPVAWAFRAGTDDSLRDAARAFFGRLEREGELAQLLDRHFGSAESFDYVDTRRFLRHAATRLPQYRHLFEEAATLSGVDWRLLAAIGYQESHWNSRARSPTGVRGIMMLTRATARHVGVQNRLDPVDSILGGAAYFNMVKRKIPSRIPEPDRTWMALAAYNIGFGHLEDARILTQKRGGDPDKWVDVEKSLPLLHEKRWYSQTRHGYARGREALAYVRNIRRYYQLLRREERMAAIESRTTAQLESNRLTSVASAASPVL